ncbi:DUF3667 domain-containing protein [Pseudoalteromonas denitrificans]|jgi:hypothetical protein|uniref:Uncharacterized protein n=1 Tax=Pseudoalteromonas denitrificans DSM 6059 TaxID=1123010 RepID=A0A1I1UAN7_9GAMM|nr:DUF3667 domain-containing protein [Pseudoalteromonas denitrificans]SFD67926.1 Protein of unknown function [Pseudoalteromonas denitrificans DSM 6059]
MNCKNCQVKLQNDAKYCLSCGQSAASLNRPFLDVVKEMTHELLDIDGKLWLTLRTMLTKPGTLTHEFNQGKRVKYTPPLRLYLAISILFFIVFSKIYQVFDPDILLTESMLSYYSKAMFVLFPAFALIVQVFFRQTFYIGNLVFSMHLHSMAYIILMVIAPLEAMERSHVIFLLLQIPPILYMTWYVLRAFKVVYQQAWWLIIIKSMAIYMVYMALLGIVFDVVMQDIS